MRSGWCVLLAGAMLIAAQGSLSGEALSQVPEQQCPSVNMTCPTLTFDAPVVISAEVSGAGLQAALSYNWSISSGRIIRGQGTNSITVDTSALAGQSLTATVDVGGIAGCPITASCSLPITDAPPVDPPVFDRYSELTFREEKQRLDNFASQLQVSPDTKAYIVVYAGRRSSAEEVMRRVKRARKYLIAEHGIAAERIVFASGGQSEHLTFQLYILPYGLTPALSPLIEPDTEPATKSKPRINGHRRRSHESRNDKQGIFS
jgi:hypothetical protein